MLYFVCKILNLRNFNKKYDGNKPLTVYIDWFVRERKLKYNLNFDTPLNQGSNYAFARLKSTLDTIGVETTNNLNSCNVENNNIIFG